MTLLKAAPLGGLILAATAIASAQQNFPLRSGEWESTTSSGIPNQSPVVLPYCLNDELWTKALTQNPTCAVQRLTVSLTGISYNVDCSSKAFQMKGRVDMSFDGMTHMVGKGSFEMTMNGKTNQIVSQSDYRWKGPTCDPSKDMNLKFKQH
jgi:hypothetical protein